MSSGGCPAECIACSADYAPVSSGRLLDEADFHPPALADGDTDAGFSQMPLDTQMATQGGTQANLLTRFGAVDVAPRRGPGQATLLHCGAVFSTATTALQTTRQSI